MSRYKLPTISDGPLFGGSKSSAPGSFGAGSLGAAVFWHRVVTYLLDRLETYRQRRSLAALDDRMLKDIGLTRCDVAAEVSRPFWR